MNPKSFNPIKVQMLADYEERLRSLRSDGYRLRFDHLRPDFCFASLKHMVNGNNVTLSLDFHARRMRQFTNHILTHLQEYPESL